MKGASDPASSRASLDNILYNTKTKLLFLCGQLSSDEDGIRRSATKRLFRCCYFVYVFPRLPDVMCGSKEMLCNWSSLVNQYITSADTKCKNEKYHRLSIFHVYPKIIVLELSV